VASSTHAEAAGVAELDRLAKELLAAAIPLRAGRASTSTELRSVYQLRCDQVIAAGWAERSAFPAGIERDPYDDRAVQVAVWDDDSLVGTLRVVLPVAGAPLPVENDFGIEAEPRGGVVEIGRLVVAPERRGDPGRTAWGALLGQAWLEVRSRGYVVVAGAASKGLVERFQSLGLPFEILGPARPHWGGTRHPVRLDGSDASPRWFDRTS
jgi:hypothetical protein